MQTKKAKVRSVAKDLERIYRKVNKKVKKYGPLSDKEINEIVRESRRKKRTESKGKMF